MKIGILVDSSSTSIKEEYNNTNIELIPLHITINGEEDILDTPELIEEHDIFQKIMNNENIKTSQASPGEIENKYKTMLKKYDHIFQITITKNLSSMYNTSFNISQQEEFKGKVTVYDNKDIAAQAIRETALHLDLFLKKNEVNDVNILIKQIEEFKKGMYLGIVPGDLRKLASGGRTSFLASVFSFLKTKILIKWAEVPEKESISRTASGIVSKVSKHVLKDYNFLFVKTPHTSQKTVSMYESALSENNIEYKTEFIPNIYPMHSGIETVGFIITKKIKP